MRYRLVVFDFDGTLVDSHATITDVANAALESCGFPPRTADVVRPLIGLPLSEVLGGLSGSAARAAELSARYRELWQQAAPAPLFDGVADMVGELHEAGVRLAIATNRRRPGLVDLLVAHGLADRFGYLVGGSCVERRKPHPEALHLILSHFGVPPDQTLMVGDTTFDLSMGRAAGTDTCAVTYGGHSRGDLAAENPTYVADHASDLPRLMGLSGPVSR